MAVQHRGLEGESVDIIQHCCCFLSSSYCLSLLEGGKGKEHTPKGIFAILKSELGGISIHDDFDFSIGSVAVDEDITLLACLVYNRRWYDCVFENKASAKLMSRII